MKNEMKIRKLHLTNFIERKAVPLIFGATVLFSILYSLTYTVAFQEVDGVALFST